MNLTDGFKTKLYRDLEDDVLVESWRELEATSSSPFATQWWASAQPEPAHSQVAVMLTQGGKAIAIATFTLQRGTLTTAAGNFRDYNDWLCSEVNKRSCALAITAALPWDDIHKIRISGLLGQDPLGDALYETAYHKGLRGWLGQIDQSPELSLINQDGERFSSYRFVFKSKNSKRLKTALKKLGHIEFNKVTCHTDISPAIQRLAELHIRRWAPTFNPSGLTHLAQRENLQRIAEKAFSEGHLHFCELLLNGIPISSSMGYLINDTYSFHVVAFNANIPGNSTIRSHLAYLLDDLAENSTVTRFNFLSGGEEYKLALATGTEPLRILDVRRERPSAIIVRLKGRLFEAIYQRPDWYRKAQKTKHTIKSLQKKVGLPITDFHQKSKEYGMRIATGKALRALTSGIHQDAATLTVSSLSLSKMVAPQTHNSRNQFSIEPGNFLDFSMIVYARFGKARSGRAFAFDERTTAGMKLFVIRNKKSIVGAGWLQLGGTYAPTETGGQQTLKADTNEDGYIIDVWTIPTQRGHGLLSILLVEMANHARSKGFYGQLHAAIDLKNAASRRGFAKCGFIEGENITTKYTT